MVPVPGKIQTRAIAVFRFPVPYARPMSSIFCTRTIGSIGFFFGGGGVDDSRRGTRRVVNLLKSIIINVSPRGRVSVGTPRKRSRIESTNKEQSNSRGGTHSSRMATTDEEPPSQLDDEVSAMFDLGKKKKKKKKTEPTEPVADEVAAMFDLTKKKKKKKKTEEPVEEEEQQLGEAVEETKDGREFANYSYKELLDRVVGILQENNPELAEKRRHSLAPPQLMRVGTKKTLWVNFQDICKMMRRNPEHVFQFFMAELGTEGSIDGTQRLVIRGKYVPKYIESLLRKYIIEYVTCQMCRSPNTTLTRDGASRLYFIHCQDCGSSRSVAPIRSGYHATSRADRRAMRK